MPDYIDHNLGLKHLIVPGGDLRASQVRENFGRISHATNHMVESSLEPESVNTRHLSTASKGGENAHWKVLFESTSGTDFAVSKSTSWAVQWQCTFGSLSSPVVPNVPLFIKVVLEVTDTSTSGLNARYHFKLQAITPTGGTLADISWRGMNSQQMSTTERSITLCPSDATGTNREERRQVILATPYIPGGAPTDELTSIDVALLTKGTNYAGSGLPSSASSLVITTSSIQILAIRA